MRPSTRSDDTTRSRHTGAIFGDRIELRNSRFNTSGFADHPSIFIDTASGAAEVELVNSGVRYGVDPGGTGRYRCFNIHNTVDFASLACP